MVSAINPAFSGLAAFGEKLGVTANNVANVNTDGFKKSRVILKEALPNGVTPSIERINTEGAPLLPDRDTGKIRESSNVAVEEEMVSLMPTQQGYTANLKILQTEEEMLGTLFDIVDK
jgi:flagellar hook protein FlgE